MQQHEATEARSVDGRRPNGLPGRAGLSYALGMSPPPPFAWEAWYERIGGRSIKIEAVDEYLRQIFDEQYPRCFGDVAPERQTFASPEAAAAHIKAAARELGADLVGICLGARDGCRCRAPMAARCALSVLRRLDG